MPSTLLLDYGARPGAVENEKVPVKAACQKCKELSCLALEKRSWRCIKSCVKNIITTSKKISCLEMSPIFCSSYRKFDDLSKGMADHVRKWIYIGNSFVLILLNHILFVIYIFIFHIEILYYRLNRLRLI